MNKITSDKTQYLDWANKLTKISRISLTISAVALAALAASVKVGAVIPAQIAAVVLTGSLAVSLLTTAAALATRMYANRLLSREPDFIVMDPLVYSPWDQYPQPDLSSTTTQPSPAPAAAAPASAPSEPIVPLDALYGLLTKIITTYVPAAAPVFPAMSLGQSLPFARAVDADLKDPEDPEDVWSFPEVFSSLWNVAMSMVFSEPPEAALRVKASKYEALMGRISQSLEAQQLPARKLPPRPAKYTTAYLDAIRSTYETTLTYLRETSDPRLNIVCFDLYTRNPMVAENEQMLATFGVASPSSTGFVMGKLKQAFEVLKAIRPEMTTHPINRWARSAKDWMSLNFSPLNAGNPPQLLNQLQFGVGTLDILGMGSPTLQGWDSRTATIDPIFIKYLEHLRVIGKRHFYVSNQNARDPGEQVRNEQIMKLQERYPDVFVAITCSKNSEFYHGKVDESMSQFKQSLYNKFFVDPVTQSGCYLPHGVKESALIQEWARKTIDKIAESYFPSRDELTPDERRFFNEMFYTLLILMIAYGLNASYLNFTCKDGIDRGMGSLGWFLSLLLIAQGQENTEKAEKMLLHTFFTRCFWTRKRPIIEERFMRVVHDMETLNKLDPDKGKTFSLLSTLTPLPVLA